MRKDVRGTFMRLGVYIEYKNRSGFRFHGTQFEVHFGCAASKIKPLL